MAPKSPPIFITQLKNFQKKIRVGLTLCLFIKKEAQTRVSRIGNSVDYNDYPYKYRIAKKFRED